MRYWSLLAIVAAVLFGGCTHSPQYLTMKGRVLYAKEFQASCLKNQQLTLSVMRRAEYCSCAATRSAETITLEELRALTQSQEDLLKPHLASVQIYCSEKMNLLWKSK